MLFQNLFYLVNCAKPFDIFARGKQEGGLLPDKRVTYNMGFLDETVAEVLVGKHSPKRKPHSSTLEAYKETPVFILLYIMEDAVLLVVWKLSGSKGPNGADSEPLQLWLLKSRDHSKTIRISVESSVAWLSNHISLCSAFRVFYVWPPDCIG